MKVKRQKGLASVSLAPHLQSFKAQWDRKKNVVPFNSKLVKYRIIIFLKDKVESTGHTGRLLVKIQISKYATVSVPRTAPKNLRRCSSKRGHPRLKHAPPESERVLPHNNQVDQLQHSKLVQENPKNHCDNEHCQLGHN